MHELTVEASVQYTGTPLTEEEQQQVADAAAQAAAAKVSELGGEVIGQPGGVIQSG
jgi:hypothetical protein